MANVVKSTTAGVDASTAMLEMQITGKLAGEALGVLDALQIKSDNLLWKANGGAADSNANVVGFAARACAVGQPVTVYGTGVRARYADGTLTPGQRLFLSATSGRLSDAATTGGTSAIAFAIDASDIMIRGV